MRVFGVGRRIGRQAVNSPDDVHPRDYLAECRKALLVRIPGLAVVEARLVADADEKLATRGADGAARHRDHAVHMQDAGLLGGLMIDRVEPVAGVAEPALDDLDLRTAVVVLVGNHAIETAAVEIAIINPLEEVAGCDRRLVEVEIDADVAYAGGHQDANGALIGAGKPRCQCAEHQHRFDHFHAATPLSFS